MPLGTEGWGHVDLAKKLGGEARKRGCGEAEIRWGPERKSYILGLGLSQVWEEDKDPETWQMDHGTGQERGQETQQEEKEKGVVLGRKRDRKLCTTQVCSSLQSWKGTHKDCADPSTDCKYLSDQFFETRFKSMLSASFVRFFENLAEMV